MFTFLASLADAHRSFSTLLASVNRIRLAVTGMQSATDIDSSVRTSLALNREANRIAQSNPARAAELRMQAYGFDFENIDRPASGKKHPARDRQVFPDSKASRVRGSGVRPACI